MSAQPLQQTVDEKSGLKGISRVGNLDVFHQDVGRNTAGYWCAPTVGVRDIDRNAVRRHRHDIPKNALEMVSDPAPLITVALNRELAVTSPSLMFGTFI